MKETDFQAKVILFSEPSYHKTKPIITLQLRYPRMIHSELLTHRVISKNSRSSRAVPVKKLLQEEIYIPYFMKNQPGMQSFENFSFEEQDEIQKEWIRFAKETQRFSKWLSDKGVHKQWANRPLEWFGYIDTLVTSTQWDNFFALRIHKDAMPEIRELAKAMDKEIKKAISYNTEIQYLNPGEWHIPYIFEAEKNNFGLEENLKLSVARCARVSYAPFDGNSSLEKEFQRYELLKNADPIHASPFEHQAKYCETQDYIMSNFQYPWLQYRKLIEKELQK